MTPGKLGAVTVISGVLAAQLFALSPAGRGGWYWPFVDYPMYSEAKAPGATFALMQLEVADCAGQAREVTARDLGLPPFRFRNAVALSAGTLAQRPDRPRDPAEVATARRWLGDVIATAVGGEWCEVRVQGRVFRIGRHGLESADVPRQLLASWPVAGNAAQ